MSTRTITFLAESKGVTTRLMYQVSDHLTWGAQAAMFHNFLCAQGYVLDGDAVGADVRDLVDAIEDAEEEDYGY